LNEEEQRGIVEKLTEEELALFDLLKQPELSDKEKDKVKSATNELLITLKASKLVLDWRKRQQKQEQMFNLPYNKSSIGSDNNIY
jgi:type I restriction enzyme, R subunit